MPDEKVVEHGFGVLTDEQIADIVISPELLRWWREYFLDPEVACGVWFGEAILAAGAAREDDAKTIALTKEVYRDMVDEGYFT